jgi:uncharacterized cupin superfamily protein
MTSTFIRLLRDGDPKTGMGPSDMTAPDSFTSADKTELIHEFHTNKDESILSGVWECAPCREDIDAYPVDEMMSVISGSLTLTGADGKSETFTAGDVFFIPKGTKVVWEITETLRKFYMIAT